MQTITKEYVKEFREPVDFMDYWVSALYESHDMTVTNNLGVQLLWIIQVNVPVDGIKKEMFTVEIETVSEIVNWRNGEQKVLHELVEKPTYGVGEYELLEVFETWEDAETYAKKHHPEVDLKQLIKAHYE